MADEQHNRDNLEQAGRERPAARRCNDAAARWDDRRGHGSDSGGRAARQNIDAVSSGPSGIIGVLLVVFLVRRIMKRRK